MYKGLRNIRVRVKNDPTHNTMNIYLEASGREFYVMPHRWVACIYTYLENGVAIETLARWNGRSRLGNVPIHFIRSGKMERFIKHLLEVIDLALWDYGFIETEERLDA